MILQRVLPAVSLAGLALNACSKKPADEQVMCTMEARSALAVVVVDSVTGAGLAATTVALARDGTFSDTLSGRDSVVSGVFERAGTYRVELRSPGYRAWARDGITVGRDECHVQTVRLRALLVPQ